MAQAYDVDADADTNASDSLPTSISDQIEGLGAPNHIWRVDNPGNEAETIAASKSLSSEISIRESLASSIRKHVAENTSVIDRYVCASDSSSLERLDHPSATTGLFVASAPAAKLNASTGSETEAPDAE